MALAQYVLVSSCAPGAFLRKISAVLSPGSWRDTSSSLADGFVRRFPARRIVDELRCMEDFAQAAKANAAGSIHFRAGCWGTSLNHRVISRWGRALKENFRLRSTPHVGLEITR